MLSLIDRNGYILNNSLLSINESVKTFSTTPRLIVVKVDQGHNLHRGNEKTFKANEKGLRQALKYQASLIR